MKDKKIDPDKIQALLDEITEKKELVEISDEFALKELLKYIQSNTKARKFLNQAKPINPKSAVYKIIVKEVRARLRKVYGLFRDESGLSKRDNLVSALLAGKKINREMIVEILRTNSSTCERVFFYENIYQRIFEIAGRPETILDLGCGINPFSVPFMNLDSLKYYAYDLSVDEMENLNEFFMLLNKINPKIKGQAEVLDVSEVTNLPEADFCFLFKITDVLERGKGHKVTEQILKIVPARFVIVSFPTITMSGKKMNFPRRRWIELMCRRLKYTSDLLTFGNEIFYVIKK